MKKFFKNFGSGVHKVIERHLHMKPEGQEYHEKREEAYMTQKRVNVYG